MLTAAAAFPQDSGKIHRLPTATHMEHLTAPILPQKQDANTRCSRKSCGTLPSRVCVYQRFKLQEKPNYHFQIAASVTGTESEGRGPRHPDHLPPLQKNHTGTGSSSLPARRETGHRIGAENSLCLLPPPTPISAIIPVPSLTESDEQSRLNIVSPAFQMVLLAQPSSVQPLFRYL